MDKKVFVVEDNYIIRMFLENSIKKLGCNVIGVSDNSDDFLQRVKQNLPDIVLMDIGINGNINGIEASKIILEKYKIPSVFITGNSDPITLAKAKKANPVHIIIKPIDEQKLEAEFSTICEKLNF